MPNMERRKQKEQVVAKIEERLKAAKLAIFADYRGMTVAQLTELRQQLRIEGVQTEVLKNTMMFFALKNCGYNPDDYEKTLFGPNLVITSEEDLVTPAKVLYEASKKYDNLNIKMGIVEGNIVEAASIRDLAELPPREVLIATVLGTMQAPITSFVRVLNANLTGLVRALDQVREKKEAC